MNKRIRELVMSIPRIKDMYDVGPVQRASIEEFAELIIRECVHAVQNRGGMCGALASNWIKEHFEIEP